MPADTHHLIVWCDGAARGNPGPAGIGVQITDISGQVLAEIARGLGRTTNNVAEYTAAREGLRKAAELGASKVLVRSDSELLIKQLTGVYKVRNENLKKLHRQVIALAGSFETIAYEHVRRELNREADRLANEGADRTEAGLDP